MEQIFGIDVAHHNATNYVDTDMVGGKPCDFVCIKASEGCTYTDNKAKIFYNLASKRGKVIGFYHFCRPDNDNNPVTEAVNFIKTVRTIVGSDNVFLAVDVERTCAHGEDLVKWVMLFCKYVIDITGIKPLVYLNKSYLKNYDWSPIVDLDCGLWLADYNKGEIKTTGAWSICAMRQFEVMSANIWDKNVTKEIDRDIFYGSVDQLRKYCGYVNGGDFNGYSID